MRIRILSYGFLLTTANATVALAQEHATASRPVMGLFANVMVYTLVIFGIVYWVASRYAFPAILKEVEAREKALEDAIAGAKRDREAAAKLLADYTAQLETGRVEAQKFIADGRATSEKMRAELMEQTRKDQAEMLERTKRDIEGEREKAIAQLRREAVELAILGATKVIEENLDSEKNRKLVETYLGSIGTVKVTS